MGALGRAGSQGVWTEVGLPPSTALLRTQAAFTSRRPVHAPRRVYEKVFSLELRRGWVCVCVHVVCEGENESLGLWAGSGGVVFVPCHCRNTRGLIKERSRGWGGELGLSGTGGLKSLPYLGSQLELRAALSAGSQAEPEA